MKHDCRRNGGLIQVPVHAAGHGLVAAVDARIDDADDNVGAALLGGGNLGVQTGIIDDRPRNIIAGTRRRDNTEVLHRRLLCNRGDHGAISRHRQGSRRTVEIHRDHLRWQLDWSVDIGEQNDPALVLVAMDHQRRGVEHIVASRAGAEEFADERHQVR